MIGDDALEARVDSSPPGLTPEDLEALRGAKRRLESPSLTAKISNVLGTPLEAGLKMLPARWHRTISSVTQSALLRALEISIRTIGRPEPRRSRDWLHKALVTGTGTAGGAFGLVALPVELPLSTGLMLRSIADIARSEGHDVSQLDVKLACLEVFALGGSQSGDDAAETGYWMVRGALSRYMADAASHLARVGLTDKSAPAVVRFVAQVAARFGVVVSEEVAAQLVPVVGAVSGGVINYLFMNHFQDIARGHFVVKRLEKKYGLAMVRQAYEELAV